MTKYFCKFQNNYRKIYICKKFQKNTSPTYVSSTSAFHIDKKTCFASVFTDKQKISLTDKVQDFYATPKSTKMQFYEHAKKSFQKLVKVIKNTMFSTFT